MVTARKTEESLQDAPVSVTALSGLQLETKGIRDLSGVAQLTPSLTFVSDLDQRSFVAIRGVGLTNDSRVAPGVAMFVDGVYQPSPAFFNIPFFDIERIEVLKGPQGTLYGKNTLGGVISVVTRAPNGELSATASVSYARGNELDLSGSVNLPISDGIANRTSLLYRDADGVYDNKVTGEDADWREDVAFRTRFDINPSENINSSLTGFYAKLKSGTLNYSLTSQGINKPVDNIVKSDGGFAESEYYSVNFTNTIDVGNVSITSVTSYDDGESYWENDDDFFQARILYDNSIDHRKVFAQEVRLSSNREGGDGFRWLVGGYYSKEDRLNTFNTNVFFPVVGLTTLSSVEQNEDADTYAGFGQAYLRTGDVEFSVGMRYDRENRGNIAVTSSLTSPVQTRAIDDSFQAWQPKASITYFMSEGAMAYALAARGFRAGGFNLANAPLNDQSFGEEKTWNYEIGAKTEWFDRSLRLNGALFYIDYTDVIQSVLVTSQLGTALIISRNQGKARSYGGELEMAWRVSQELTLTGGFSYTNARTKNLPLNAFSRRFGFVPRTMMNLNADYTTQLTDSIGLGLRAGVSRMGKTYLGVSELRDPFTIVNVGMDINYQNVTLTLFCDNVFNEKYFTSFIRQAILAPLGVPGNIGTLSRPAEYGVRLTANF